MDRTDANFDKILSKLGQIQELIDRGATAGEVAAATGRMQALLSKHNLTIELVAHHKGERRHAPGNFIVSTSSATWERVLANGLAKANYGRCIGDSDGIHIVCHKDDWLTIQYLYSKFAPLIMKMAPIAYEQYKAQLTDWDSRDGFRTYVQPKRQWCNDWRTGCAEGIAHALYEARLDAESATQGSSALVVVKTEEVMEAVNTFYPRLVTHHTRARNSEARRSGYDTGQSLGRGTSVAG
jgi:hypothetical protein